MKVLVTGATGFVGRHLLAHLVSEGHTVRALMRPHNERGNGTFPQPGINPAEAEPIIGDVVAGAGLDAGMQGCDAVVHLVGIIVEKGNNTFEAVHHAGTANMVRAARRNGIRRFIHMSALGVRANGVAAYQTSKWKGEEAVRSSGIPYCILRPSLIFGPGDGFVTQMMDVMRSAPLVRPVPGDGSPLYRPIFIRDVTACFVRALTIEAATNQTIDLGGADELSLNQILAEIARCAGVRKPAIHIPLPLMFAAAALAEKLLPDPPVTIDQLRMLREGSTCDIRRMKQIFAIDPRGFTGCGRQEP